MLKIRLQRIGRVHEPSFRLVLTDSKNSTKSGRFKEILGSYDPRKSTDALETERIKYWLSCGASPTDTVHNLLIKHKVITAKKINVSRRPSSAAQANGGQAAKSEEIPVAIPVAKEDAIIEPVVEEKVEEEKTV